MQPTSRLIGASSMLGQSCPPLQVGLDLLSVAAESPLDLLVEVGIPVVDEVHILVSMEASSPAVAGLLLLPAGWQAQSKSSRKDKEVWAKPFGRCTGLRQGAGVSSGEACLLFAQDSRGTRVRRELVNTVNDCVEPSPSAVPVLLVPPGQSKHRQQGGSCRSLLDPLLLQSWPAWTMRSSCSFWRTEHQMPDATAEAHFSQHGGTQGSQSQACTANAALPPAPISHPGQLFPAKTRVRGIQHIDFQSKSNTWSNLSLSSATSPNCH